MKSIKVCEYSRSRSFHDDLILQDQDSGERSQDQWSSGHTFFQIMSEYDQTFDPSILIGHWDLISRFSDFALYLGTQMVYEQTSFKVFLHMTRPLTLK